MLIKKNTQGNDSAHCYFGCSGLWGAISSAYAAFCGSRTSSDCALEKWESTNGNADAICRSRGGVDLLARNAYRAYARHLRYVCFCDGYKRVNCGAKRAVVDCF